MTIDNFSGKYRFLSNFHPSVIMMGGMYCRTVEHAYQASKSLDSLERRQIIEAATPGMAKKLGQWVIHKVPNWQEIKVTVMTDLVNQKFTKHADLRTLLLMTEEEELIEGNTWNDTFWGVCKGKGENHLGQILMLVRSNIRKQMEPFRKP